MERLSIVGRTLSVLGSALAAGTFLLTAGGAQAAVTVPTLTVPAAGGATYATTNRTPMFGGAADSGDTIKLDIDGTQVASATGTAGAWSITLGTAGALSVGSHAVTVTACVSSACATSSPPLTLDELPSTPQITSPISGSASTDTTPTISGSADPGDTVAVYIDGANIAAGSVTADGSGKWTLTLTSALATGTHSVYAVATDEPSTLSSAASASDSFVVLPPAPTITAPTNGAQLTSTATTVCGTAAAGEPISLLLNGTTVDSTTAGLTGSWCIATTVAYGVDTLVAVGTDSHGDESPSTAVEVNVATPVSPSVTPASSSGATLGVNQDVTLTFNGSFKSRCSLTPESIESCAVTAYSSSKQIAYGIRTFTTTGTHTTIVTAKLNALGRKLLAASGTSGLHVTLEMKLDAFGGSIYNVNGATIAYLPFAKLAFTVHFAFGSSALTAAARKTIIADAAKLKGESVVLCDGNTDSIGTWSYNYALGIRRANAVCNVLKSLGIRTRVGIRSYSYDYPVASNATSAGRALNRRTAVWVTFASTPRA